MLFLSEDRVSFLPRGVFIPDPALPPRRSTPHGGVSAPFHLPGAGPGPALRDGGGRGRRLAAGVLRSTAPGPGAGAGAELRFPLPLTLLPSAAAAARASRSLSQLLDVAIGTPDVVGGTLPALRSRLRPGRSWARGTCPPRHHWRLSGWLRGMGQLKTAEANESHISKAMALYQHLLKEVAQRKEEQSRMKEEIQMIREVLGLRSCCWCPWEQA
ncbi:uncharacterized protein LOC115616836 [Strigops habroptila]|uniref:uncharacterized protein LOC115616836 n=1 Tax=Strigops habroptila TaxID=2489341 RepID=UPI0011CF311B|nr:uncharacterized protein LOC115616836 [Strigops habroptila]